MTNENEQACNADLILKGQDDLIRRGDALKVALVYSHNEIADKLEDAILDIPSVTISLHPLVWFEVERGTNGYGKWTAQGYTVRKIEGLFLLDFAGEGKSTWRFITSDEAKAAAQADYEARILAAIVTQPIYDPRDAVITRLVEAVKFYADWDSWVLDERGVSLIEQDEGKLARAAIEIQTDPRDAEAIASYSCPTHRSAGRHGPCPWCAEVSLQTKIIAQLVEVLEAKTVMGADNSNSTYLDAKGRRVLEVAKGLKNE